MYDNLYRITAVHPARPSTLKWEDVCFFRKRRSPTQLGTHLLLVLSPSLCQSSRLILVLERLDVFPLLPLIALFL